MNRLLFYFRSTRHLYMPLAILIAGGIGFAFLRARMVPETFGDTGAYRAAALEELAARPGKIQADRVCLECHDNVKEERAGTLHEAVRCFHCHGQGHEHVAQARKAKDSPETTIEKAHAWDGDFMTKIDLFITKDRATCLSCHESVVGMPGNFKKINVATHLEEMGSSDATSREACFECHAGHNTKP